MRTLRVVLAAIGGLSILPACSTQAPPDDGVKARMAADLVQCKNDLSSQKDKVAELQAEIAKLKTAATVQLEPVDLKAGTEKKHMEGNIPPEKLSAVITKNSGGLRSCYERGLKRNPNLQYVSSVNVHFSVKNTGEATGVGFSPHADTEMESCMASAIAKWRFPSFDGDPVQVEAPVNLIAK